MSEIDKKNSCLGCGIPLEIGEVCYHCLFDGLTLTQIHSTTGRTRVKGCDNKEYVIWAGEGF